MSFPCKCGACASVRLLRDPGKQCRVLICHQVLVGSAYCCKLKLASMLGLKIIYSCDPLSETEACSLGNGVRLQEPLDDQEQRVPPYPHLALEGVRDGCCGAGRERRAGKGRRETRQAIAQRDGPQTGGVLHIAETADSVRPYPASPRFYQNSTGYMFQVVSGVVTQTMSAGKLVLSKKLAQGSLGTSAHILPRILWPTGFLFSWF